VAVRLGMSDRVLRDIEFARLVVSLYSVLCLLACITNATGTSDLALDAYLCNCAGAGYESAVGPAWKGVPCKGR
jgi:hypothetical protein